MSFFDDKNNTGLLLIIIGALSVVFGIVSMFLGDDGVTVREVLSAVGSAIAGLIYILLGIDIRKGTATLKVMNFFDDLDSKFGLLVAIVTADGVASLISGIFSLSIFTIIVAILILVMVYLMMNGGTLAGNIIWIILLIVFILNIIAGAIACLVLVGIPFLLLAIIELLYLLSPEVKAKMGM